MTFSTSLNSRQFMGKSIKNNHSWLKKAQSMRLKDWLTNVLSRVRSNTWLSGKVMGTLITRGFKRATYKTLRKPSNSLKNFCHRCQKPEGGVVLGIDILISIM